MYQGHSLSLISHRESMTVESLNCTVKGQKRPVQGFWPEKRNQSCNKVGVKVGPLSLEGGTLITCR